MTAQGTLGNNQHSLRKNWSPGSWEFRSKDYFPPWERLKFPAPLLSSACLLYSQASISGCSPLPCTAWQWLSVQIQPRVTGVSTLRPNSWFPAGRMWLLQPKARRRSDQLWEVGSHYCLLRSQRSKIPETSTCRDSLKRVSGQKRIGKENDVHP